MINGTIILQASCHLDLIHSIDKDSAPHSTDKPLETHSTDKTLETHSMDKPLETHSMDKITHLEKDPQ
jgi:hypothetical protein